MKRVIGPYVFQGGGAKNLNYQSLAKDLARATLEIPFNIPPYFALVARALGILEGIYIYIYFIREERKRERERGSSIFVVKSKVYCFLQHISPIDQTRSSPAPLALI